MSLTIRCLVEETLSSGIFTAHRENQIFALLDTGEYSPTDLDALDQLIEAITRRNVVSGHECEAT